MFLTTTYRRRPTPDCDWLTENRFRYVRMLTDHLTAGNKLIANLSIEPTPTDRIEVQIWSSLREYFVGLFDVASRVPLDLIEREDRVLGVIRCSDTIDLSLPLPTWQPTMDGLMLLQTTTLIRPFLETAWFNERIAYLDELLESLRRDGDLIADSMLVSADTMTLVSSRVWKDKESFLKYHNDSVMKAFMAIRLDYERTFSIVRSDVFQTVDPVNGIRSACIE